MGLAILFLLALAGVWTAGRLSPGYTLDVGPQEWGRAQDVNDWEENDLFSYRWTREESRFRLPILGTPRWLVLRLDGTRPAGVEPAEVSLVLDGQMVLVFQPPPGPHLYHVVYDGSGPWRWETDVELRANAFQPPGDPRVLGVVVDRLHFSRPLQDAGPAWLLVVFWMVIGLAAVALGRGLGWSWERSGVLAALLVLGLSLLLAWFRPVVLPWAGLLLVLVSAGAVVARIFRGPAGPPWEREPCRFDRQLSPLARLCLVVALGVSVLPLLTPWLPAGGSWALRMLEPGRIYPPAGPIPRALLRWLPLVAVAWAAIPFVNRDLRGLVRRIGAAGQQFAPRLRPPGRWLFLGLLFVPLGYLLRSRLLWGDGPHLIAFISAGHRFKEAELLASLLHGVLYAWTERWWGWQVPDVYTLTSLVAGALYVALSAALSDTLGRGRFERTFVFGLLVTLGTVQFGFGYLENYAWITVALLALFWQMARCLEGEVAPAPVVALWVLACACHLQALLVGPAVLYTLVRSWRAAADTAARRRQVGTALLGGLLPALLLGGLLWAAGYDLNAPLEGAWTRGNNPYTLVPLQSNTTYTLFSLRHLANLVNEHLLVAPVVLPLLLVLLLLYARKIPWRDPLVVALLLGSLGLLFFASTMYPDLGPSMDWDLFAPAALPYTMLGGLLYVRVVPDGESKRYAAVVLLVAAGMHAALWVLLNAMWL